MDNVYVYLFEHIQPRAIYMHTISSDSLSKAKYLHSPTTTTLNCNACTFLLTISVIPFSISPARRQSSKRRMSIIAYNRQWVWMCNQTIFHPPAYDVWQWDSFRKWRLKLKWFVLSRSNCMDVLPQPLAFHSSFLFFFFFFFLYKYFNHYNSLVVIETTIYYLWYF